MSKPDMENSRRHVAVIGAGIVGTCCAWHLRRRGFAVSLIDRVPPGQSCSYGNASCISASSIIPFSYPGIIRKVPRWLVDPLGPLTIRPADFPALLPWFWRFWRAGNMQTVEAIAGAQTQLMKSVFDDYDEMLDATDSAYLRRRQGAIHLYDTAGEYHRDKWQFDLLARFGFKTRVLSRESLRDMVPGLKLPHGVALLMPDWQHLLDPAVVTARFAEHAMSDGVDWLQDDVIHAQSAGEHIRLRMQSGGIVHADKLVVAAGAWSNIIAAQLDQEVPLTAKRGYHSMIRNPGVQLAYPVMSLSRSFVMTPMQDGLRLAGTAEFAAVDAKPDYRRAKVLLKHAAHYLDGLHTGDVSEWMGQRPMMADSLPVISASPRHRNVYYAFGHGHYGLTQGPTTGRIVADLVAGREASIDLAPYRFDRFG